MAAHRDSWIDERGFQCDLEGTDETGIVVTATRTSDGAQLQLSRRNPVIAKRAVHKLISVFLETGQTADFLKHSEPPYELMYGSRRNRLTATVGARSPSDLEGEAQVTSNHTGYRGGENYEHDDTGALMNYSGVEDEMFSAEASHEGWKPGYDY